jgi:selenocysteine-specific elongation factor
MDATTGASNSENSTKRAQPRILNINVGVLGHVDSGKTSLGKDHNSACTDLQQLAHQGLVFSPAVAALSTKLSTAALDKHPQSKERGITLDLGFSSFTVEELACDVV